VKDKKSKTEAERRAQRLAEALRANLRRRKHAVEAEAGSDEAALRRSDPLLPRIEATDKAKP
jgi:hypothetical protein